MTDLQFVIRQNNSSSINISLCFSRGKEYWESNVFFIWGVLGYEGRGMGEIYNKTVYKILM